MWPLVTDAGRIQIADVVAACVVLRCVAPLAVPAFAGVNT